MKGGRLSRPKHCSKGAQPMLKTVYRSSCRDKHNRTRRDSNLDPLTLQSDALTTRPLRPAYANNLHITPHRKPHQHLITQIFFTGRMLFLMPNQQCQSTEDTKSIYNYTHKHARTHARTHTHTRLTRLTAICPGLPR